MYFVSVFICVVVSIVSGDMPFFVDFTTDTKTNPCDNFYAYSCSNWKKNTKNPGSEPIWNHWLSTSYKINDRLANLLTKNTPDLGEARKFFRACLSNESHLQELEKLTDDLTSHSDWLESVYSITNTLGIHPIVKITVGIDYNNPGRHILYIGPGELTIPKYIINSPKTHRHLSKWMKETFSLFNTKIPNISDIINFELTLAALPTNGRKRYTFKQLLRKFPQFKTIANVKSDSVVVVESREYFKQLFRITKQANVTTYLRWSVISDLTRDVSEKARNLNFLVNKAVLHLHKHVPKSTYCVEKTTEYFPSTLAPIYAQKFVTPKIIDDVTEMVDKIRKQLLVKVNQSTWLSEEARSLIGDKIVKTKAHLGWDQSAVKVTDVKMTGDHFVNLIRLKKQKSIEEFDRLNKQVNYVRWMNPFDVNAYYSILQNAIFLPLGILTPPFYDRQRPPAVNYATLGALIGHELTHSVDPIGIGANAVGRVGSWLPTQDKIAISSRCAKTEAETIADKVGLDIAYKALKDRRDKLFFTSFAQIWCEIGSTDYVDEHEGVEKRVNQVVYENKYFREVFECESEWDVNDCKLW